ncbi:MAG: hypothetical protein JWN33_625 [Candidatus Saccharibacteria bacterium]|nr:hypothetical protein [Candidatus Saccharibacteria bacterium]
MISLVDIVGIKYEVDDTTKKYITKKIARLDRYLPRHARKSATAEVRLREVNRDHGNKYEAEVIINLPDKQLVATDCTVNMLAAIDIVEAKIMAQLHRYKETTIDHVGKRRFGQRLNRSF